MYAAFKNNYPIRNWHVTKKRAPSPKLSCRGRLLFGSVAGLILAATLSLHFWYFPLFGQKPIDEYPALAEGRVIAKEPFQDVTGTMATRIIYRFQTQKGRFVKGQSSARHEKWTDTKIGDTIQILYSERNPQLNRPVSIGHQP